MDRETALIKQELENLKNRVNSLANKVEFFITSFNTKPKLKKQKE